MEENTVELFDYLRVIWKRKILIIVMTLVCLVVGVVIINSKSKLSPAKSYYASAYVKIGKRVAMSRTEVHLVPVENPETLEKTIPLMMYEKKINEAHGYQLDVKMVANDLLKLTLRGCDKEVERVLKEMVDILIDNHRKKSKSSAVAYESFIKKLKTDAKMIQENITIIEASIIKMKKQEKKSTEQMETSARETGGEKNISDLSVVWNMLYLKTIDKEIDLSKSRRDLRDIQWQILVYQTTIGSFETYNTEMNGDMRFDAVTPIAKSSIHTITVAGAAGFIMSIFIAFFIEYIEEAKSRRNGKGKVNSA